VAARIGIDPEPPDPADPEDAAWLRALIWPEQEERARRLAAALALAAEERPKVVAGDAFDRLAAIVTALPREGALVVSHSFTLNQFTPAAKTAFTELLQGLGQHRPLYRVALEWGRSSAPKLTLFHHSPAGTKRALLATCDAHGAWLEWPDSD
jgi:hypothetical protein